MVEAGVGSAGGVADLCVRAVTPSLSPSLLHTHTVWYLHRFSRNDVIWFVRGVSFNHEMFCLFIL